MTIQPTVTSAISAQPQAFSGKSVAKPRFGAQPAGGSDQVHFGASQSKPPQKPKGLISQLIDGVMSLFNQVARFLQGILSTLGLAKAPAKPPVPGAVAADSEEVEGGGLEELLRAMQGQTEESQQREIQQTLEAYRLYHGLRQDPHQQEVIDLLAQKDGPNVIIDSDDETLRDGFVNGVFAEITDNPSLVNAEKQPIVVQVVPQHLQMFRMDGVPEGFFPANVRQGLGAEEDHMVYYLVDSPPMDEVKPFLSLIKQVQEQDPNTRFIFKVSKSDLRQQKAAIEAENEAKYPPEVDITENVDGFSSVTLPTLSAEEWVGFIHHSSLLIEFMQNALPAPAYAGAIHEILDAVEKADIPLTFPTVKNAIGAFGYVAKQDPDAPEPLDGDYAQSKANEVVGYLGGGPLPSSEQAPPGTAQAKGDPVKKEDDVRKSLVGLLPELQQLERTLQGRSDVNPELIGSLLISYVNHRMSDSEGAMGKQPETFSIIDPANINVTMDDIVGLEEPKAEVRSYMRKLRYPERAELLAEGDRNANKQAILLYGPAGNGKTDLAKAVAKEAGATFINAQSQLTTELKGSELRNSKKIIDAIKNSPTEEVVVFLDEPDGMGKRENSEHTNSSAEIAKWLQIVEGFEGYPGKKVFFMLATNKALNMDEAILSRFYPIEVPNPTPENREEILQRELAFKKLQPVKGEKVDWGTVRRLTNDFSGRDLRDVAQRLQRILDDREAKELGLDSKSAADLTAGELERVNNPDLRFTMADLTEAIRLIRKKADFKEGKTTSKNAIGFGTYDIDGTFYRADDPLVKELQREGKLKPGQWSYVS